MSDFLKIIDAKLDGNSWEDICVKCYQYRYANEHYTPVPAASGGDAVIEGYTKLVLCINAIVQSANFQIMSYMVLSGTSFLRILRSCWKMAQD